ncbi:PREDICTED: uncharacterized protein LOC105365972 [Ceratosolen solmsi marchali]|uniref:Uncharacterized protein LOC105365972 n=1 Tax=Ceratosolen solmsi marchali TaxID=326594 RepID=A0AAJ7DZX2_9HYME|nr:PREDICTED: uncharacterized protein LOC105365972 [Ceratosolen solmsi marchali]
MLLAQIEAILNSRPLEPLSDDPEDTTALTPGHFLTGGPLTAIPEPSLKEVHMSRLSRWQFIQQRVQQFWSLWSTHYLQRQQSISKWHHPQNDIKEGSIVLITDERLPPSKWPLARIILANIIKAAPSIPIAQLSIIGRLVLGEVNEIKDMSTVSFHTSVVEVEEILQELLTRFWVQEGVPRSIEHLQNLI